MGYTYKLYKDNKEQEDKKNRYRRQELMKMTTYQLREICTTERLIKHTMTSLNQEELVRLIMRYRGAEESLLIQEPQAEGQDRLQEHLISASKKMLDGRHIKIPAKLIVYKEIGIELFDQYKVTSNEALDEGNILLVDEAFKLYAIFNLIKGEDNIYYLTQDKRLPVKESSKKHYKLLYFEKQQSELIYDIYYNNIKNKPNYITCYELPVIDFSIKTLAETDTPLAIDFGSTNTTAGIYKEINDFKKDEVSIVEVIDTTAHTLTITPLIPSVVGIKKIRGEKIDYVFGYEAIELSKLSYVDEGICLFYDIKRWVSDFERQEQITDLSGQKTFIKRKDILQAFLEYVIDIARQRFKCQFKKIHISCPAKQKYTFYRLFKHILSDYEVEYENMLDEGGAVIFSTLSQIIEKEKYQDGVYYKALIIDCGGGTTDLSSCTFKIENNKVAYDVEIETAYENGDTDFGGNNLTFRIMQLLKILFVNKLLAQDKWPIEALLEPLKEDVFRAVDDGGTKEVYKRLEEAYKEAEQVLPTRFKDYEDHSSEDYYKVKNNFYTLFELADEIKKTFFEQQNILDLRISPEAQGYASHMVNYNKWKLHSYIKAELMPLKDAPSFELNIYEMNTLLRADVYQVIKKFLEGIYLQDKLSDYAIIKLTGQSCKIELFREALKEFIPGRIIQFRQNKKEQKDYYDLKLACLKGALKYLQAKKFGYMNLKVSTHLPSLPYVISAYNHRGEEKELIHSLDQNNLSGHISRTMEHITLKLYLKDTQGTIKHEYDYHNLPKDFKPTLAEELERDYPQVIYQEETDNIENNEVKFFVWARPKEWGFSVVPILRQEESLWVGREAFFLFEGDEWETNFFDGLK